MLGFLTSVLNSILNLVQTLIFARRIRACVLEEPPIFIIGHWRTGTTFLHELLMLDERFTAPTTLECFAPADCMVLDQLMRHLFNFALPPRRPMDNMPVGWDRPQEDEFALMNLGLGSPYEVVVFPNRRRARHPFLDMSGLTPEQIEAWKAGFLSFLQQVNLRSKKEQVSLEGVRRIVLKSPYHTARLHILREMFPEAKFIHIVQDPCEVFPSTVQPWRAMSLIMSNMSATEWICFIAISSGKIAQIPACNFCQVRCEDLIRAPIEELGRMYRQLQFGSLEKIRPRLEAYVRGLDGYRTNQHYISPRQRAEVYRRWHWYMHRFGYHPSAAT
jgi:hypothetical protein